jgi:integrase
MKGHLRQRSAGSFELKFDSGRDAAGERIIEYRSFRGTKRQAQTELARLIAAVDKGEHVARSTLTVGAGRPVEGMEHSGGEPRA